MKTRRAPSEEDHSAWKKYQQQNMITVAEEVFIEFTKLKKSTRLDSDELLKLLIEVYLKNHVQSTSSKTDDKRREKQQTSTHVATTSKCQPRGHITMTRSRRKLENKSLNCEESFQSKRKRCIPASGENSSVHNNVTKTTKVDNTNDADSVGAEVHIEEKHFELGNKKKCELTDNIERSEKSMGTNNEALDSHEHPQSQIALVLLSMSQSHKNGAPTKNQSEETVTNFDKEEEDERPQEEIGNITVKKKYSCDQCEYHTNKKSDLKTHGRIHTGARPYTCSECNVSFRQRHHLRYHELTHSNSFNYKCSHCPKSFRTISKLRIHLKTHNISPSEDTKGQAKVFKCSQCDYKTSTASELRKHSNTHSSEKNFKCEFCEFTTSWKKNLRIHRMRHTGEKPYSCKDCPYATYDSHALRRHKIQEHSEEEAYMCEVCGTAFTQRKLLHQHQVVHTGERPYQCPHCDYCAGYRSNLRSHLLMHNPKKGFVCDQCGKAFRQKQHLSSHQKNKHSNPSKVFQCKVCEYRTAVSQSFNSHMRIHSMNNKKKSQCQHIKTQGSHTENNDHSKELQVTTDFIGRDPYKATIANADDTNAEHDTTTEGKLENEHRHSSPSKEYSSDSPYTSPQHTSPILSVSDPYALDTIPDNCQENPPTQILTTLTLESRPVHVDVNGRSGMPDIPEQNVGIQIPIQPLEDNGEVCEDNEIDPATYDQQGDSLFQYERMAAVLGNMIPDFHYQP